MRCRQFTTEPEETTTTVLKTSLPTDIVGLLKDFYASTPIKGDLFVIGESYRPRLSKYNEDAFTVRSVKRKRHGVISVNLAGKLKESGELRHRFQLKLWSVDSPESDNHGNTVILHDRLPYFLVRKTSRDYEELRPKDFVFPKEVKPKRDARKHFKIGDVLYRHFDYYNGYPTYAKHIVEKVTKCFVKLVGEYKKIKVSYRDHRKDRVLQIPYLFDGHRSYNLFENRR
jgi:hypothetical protein